MLLSSLPFLELLIGFSRDYFFPHQIPLSGENSIREQWLLMGMYNVSQMCKTLIKTDKFRLNKKAGSYLMKNGVIYKAYIMQTRTEWLHYLQKCLQV